MVINLHGDKGHKKSDERIIKGILEGDEKCENLFYIKYRDHLERYAYQLCKDQMQAEDILQDAVIITLIRLREGKIDYKHDGYLLASMKTTVKYIWFNVSRKKGRHPESTLDESYITDLTDDDFESIPLDDIAIAALYELDEDCLNILISFYYEEKTMKEIYQEFDKIISENYARKFKHKCMNKLRKAANSGLSKHLE